MRRFNIAIQSRRARLVRALGLFVFLSAVTALPAALMAQSRTRPALVEPDAGQPVIITADTVTWLRTGNMLDFSGDVVLEHPDYVVEAERVIVDLDSKKIKAMGKVTLIRTAGGEESEVLTGEAVELDIENETGLMARSRLSVPYNDMVFTFEGDRVEKVDATTYLVEDGSFTWCQCERGEVPDWKVGAEKIEADTEGDAKVRGARVYIRDRQVGALPYFRYPIGQDRRTGFLMPVIETSNSDGLHLELPFYIVLGQSMDATVQPRYIMYRGIDLGGEFRYNFGEYAHGGVHGFGIDDSQEGVMRGGARLEHRTDIGDVFSAAVDAAFISDNEAVYDFDHREIGDDRKLALESRGYASLHWYYMNLTAEVSVFDDLMGGDVRESPYGEDRDEEMVQRLPAIHYNVIDIPVWGPLVFDLNAYAANYYRQDVALGRGQFYTAAPRMVLPVRLFDTVDFYAAGGWREYMMVPDPEFDPDATSTGRAEAELLISSQFERVFETETHAYRHDVRPEIIGFWGSEPGEPHDEFFKTMVPDSPMARGGLHLDSRLWSRKREGRRIGETARVEITQFYDFHDQEYRDLRLEGRLGAPTQWRLYLDAYHSWEEWEWSRVITGVGYDFSGVLEPSVGYRSDSGNIRSPYFDFETAENEAVFGDVVWVPAERHELRYDIYYSIEYDRLIRQSLRYDYTGKQRCWGVTAGVKDRVKIDDPDGEHEISGYVNFTITDPQNP